MGGRALAGVLVTNFFLARGVETDPFALSLSKGRAAQMLTKPQRVTKFAATCFDRLSTNGFQCTDRKKSGRSFFRGRRERLF